MLCHGVSVPPQSKMTALTAMLRILCTRDHRRSGPGRVWIDGRQIQLTFQEFELLAFLAAHPAAVFTRAELVEHVWRRALGQDGQPLSRDSRTVDVHVSRVRHKLGPRYGQCLVTEYRVGYQFRPLAS